LGSALEAASCVSASACVSVGNYSAAYINGTLVERWSGPGAPYVSIGAPASGARYAPGQMVVARYDCQDAADGPGIASCVGTVPNGSRIDTATPGRRTFTVTATNKDGLRASGTVSYTILPTNEFAVSRVKTKADGTIKFSVAVPGPGSVDVLATAWNDNLARAAVLVKPAPNNVVFARKYVRAADRGTVSVAVKPNRRGRLLIAHHQQRVVLRLWVSYTPDGGRYRTIGFLGVHLPGNCANYTSVTALKRRTVVRCN
jgi:hypothetical protein